MLNNNIKSMKLYNFIDRVYNELKELGKETKGKLSVNELSSFDQLHYHGTEAIDFVIEKFKIEHNFEVLEIGSGLGGPARYLAKKTGARVTAVELQQDHNDAAVYLTKRCCLDSNVEHICGDFLNLEFPKNHFNIVVSWLALYHIPNRKKLLQKCINLLKPNGYFFGEDFACYKPFSENEKLELSKDFFANYLVSFHQYKTDLSEAGFSNILIEDMTKSWSIFTKERYKSYQDNIKRHTRVHNKVIVQNMLYFYEFAMRYLDGGKLGGIRVFAKK